MTTFSSGGEFMPCRFQDRYLGDVGHWFWILAMAGGTKSWDEVQAFPQVVWYEPEAIS